MNLKDLFFHNKTIAIITGLSFFLVFLFFLKPRTDDIWWRLYFGEKIVKTQSVPSHNEVSYAFENHHWVDHAWGYDVLSYLSYSINNNLKFTIFLHKILLLFVFTVIVINFPQINFFISILLSLLFLFHYALRPYVLSDFFFVNILLIKKHLSNQNFFPKNLTKVLLYIFLTFFIFLLWFNLHGFAFIASGTWFLLFLEDFFLTKNKKSIYFAIIPFITLFLTPYGFNLVILFWKYLIGSYSFLNNLEEWRKPSFFQMGLLIFSISFSLFNLKTFNSYKKHKITAFLTIVFLLEALLHKRYIPTFLIFYSLTLFFSFNFKINFKNTSKMLYLMSLGILLLILSLWFSIDVNQKSRFYPKKTFKTLSANINPHKTYKVFTLHTWSGSLIWHFKGKLKPFIDPRNDCYPSKAFDVYNRINKTDVFWYEDFKRFQPDIVILPDNHPLIPKLLKLNYHQIKSSNSIAIILKKHSQN